LKRDGLVRTSLEESPSGPARKYYELTRRGEQLRDDMNVHWDLLTRGIAAIRERAK
jgi:PadR family transcriptional regulator PadR